MNEDLRDELVAMAEADQDFRRRGASLSREEVREELEREHARSARAADVIAEHGWPGTSLVGDEGANAIWLLIQHADHDVELQERCLELLADVAAEGEASPRNVAYLTDRVCVNRGRNQIYGRSSADAEAPSPRVRSRIPSTSTNGARQSASNPSPTTKRGCKR